MSWTGVHAVEYPIAELIPFIDWNPFFSVGHSLLR
jgi:cobalamin-dependent methionine synthase I